MRFWFDNIVAIEPSHIFSWVIFLLVNETQTVHKLPNRLLLRINELNSLDNWFCLTNLLSAQMIYIPYCQLHESVAFAKKPNQMYIIQRELHSRNKIAYCFTFWDFSHRHSVGLCVIFFPLVSFFCRRRIQPNDSHHFISSFPFHFFL